MKIQFKYNKEELFHSFHQGDETSFAIIFKEYYPAVCYYAGRYTKDKDAAEDIVQDCFIKLWQRHNKFSNLPKLRAYLYKIVRFACIDYLKDRGKAIMGSPADENEEPVLHHIIRSETWRQVNTLIENLPPAVAKVIRMIYIEGKSIRETAEELHKSVHTIKSHRQKGITLLRNHEKGSFLSIFTQLIQTGTAIQIIKSFLS